MQSNKIGTIRLSENTEASQVYIFLTVITCLLCMRGYIALLQPLVLDNLGVATGDHGKLTGNLATVDQIAALALISIFGALADRWGRRLVLIFAIVGMTAATVFYPLAGTVLALFTVRAIFGISGTALSAGGATKIVDYPHEDSRGKFVSFMLIVQGLTSAVLIGQVAARIPGWLLKAGLTKAEAANVSFLIVALLGILAFVLATWFLQKDRPHQDVEAGIFVRKRLTGFVSNLAAVARHASANKQFRLIMALALVIRSDFAIVEVFLSLWVVSIARSAGIEQTEALVIAGLCFSILHIANLASPAIFGFLVDRYDRSLLLLGALALGLITYSVPYILGVTLGWPLYLCVLAIGLSESGTIVCAQTMLGQQSPPDLRGSAMGVFIMLGTVGVIAVNVAAGFLFDILGPTAPFALVGALNGVFFFVALAMLGVGRARKIHPVSGQS